MPSESVLAVDLYTREARLTGDALTYLSVVAAWLCVRSADSELLVEGVIGHPITRMSEIGSDVAERWRKQGY
jgi:hypothetical protein